MKVSVDRQVVRRSSVIYNNNNPKWAMTFDFGTQDMSAGKKVRFEVWDEDNNWDDDLLGECEQDLTAEVKEDLCNLQHGRLYFKWEVTCAPSLSGPTCMDYKPSPMNHFLQKVYVSRNAHPIPKAILMKMGVFVDGSSPQNNQSLTAESQQCGEI